MGAMPDRAARIAVRDLASILEELLRNAVEFTPAGGGDVVVSACGHLVDLTGLGGVTSIGGGLDVSGNDTAASTKSQGYRSSSDNPLYSPATRYRTL
jgi:hypothetical protein